MQQLPPVTPFIESAFSVARAKYSIEHKAWIDLSYVLSGRVSLAPMIVSIQRAGELDLVLRAMEDEFEHNKINGGSQFQVMFSETWVLACYEPLRAFRQRERETAGRMRSEGRDTEPDAISENTSFKSIFADFELLRMPIAKFEIAKDDSIKEPLVMRAVTANGDTANDKLYDRHDPARVHIMPAGLSQSGSITWQVLDHRSSKEYFVERRKLSNALLALKDTIEPSGLREARLASREAT